MSANVDTMAYTGEQPWHRQGVDLGDRYVKYEEMLAAAQMDWTVSIRELAIKGTGIEVPNHFAVARDDDDAVLGVVSRRYAPVQNRAAFEFLDAVVGGGQAVYHTAGSLGRGEKTWILVKLPETIEVAGDQIDNYLALVNSHDGKGAFQALWTPIRVVCENTLNVATHRGRLRSGYRLSHFANIEARMSVEGAQEALGLAGRAMGEFKEMADELSQRAVTHDQVTGFLQRLFPLDQKAALPAPKTPTLLLPEPKREDVAPDFRFVFSRRDKTRELIQSGRGNKGETRWDALNGVVEYADFEYGAAEHRTRSTLFGFGKDLKAKAVSLLDGTDETFRPKGL